MYDIEIVEIKEQLKERAIHTYLKKILKTSMKYLEEVFTKPELISFLNDVYKIEDKEKEEIVDKFTRLYLAHIKSKYQKSENPHYNKQLYKSVKADTKKVKIFWGNSYNFLKEMPTESVQLMVTSPPYYNAREYSQWADLNDYLSDMKKIIEQAYRVLDNHRVFIFNIGDIFDNDNLQTKSVWGDRRLPLGAYFIKIFEDVGFTFVDDFIWDKGEVQSERHKNGST
ncbi:MAG: DNA methyltransferase, partial [Nitrosotalea sp.]